jgi:undecaprenyl-diphosphatase
MAGLINQGNRFWLGVAAVVSLLAGAALLLDEVLEGATKNFDNAILLALRTTGNPADPIGPPWFEEAARDVTALGSFTLLFGLVGFVTLYLFMHGKPRNAWFLVVSSTSGAVLSTLLKMAIDRPRPDLTGVARVFTASFPSGHALISAVVFLTIGVFVARAASSRMLAIYSLASAGLITITVGLSRIYLGVHYPTDVIAGWLIGTGWALTCWLVVEVVMRRRGK